MPKIHTHYDNLKVSRTAPPEVIKAAYKSLVQKYHPDKNLDNPQATEIVILLNHAYETLSNPIKRKEHDLWIEQQERIQNPNKSSIFDKSANYSSNINHECDEKKTRTSKLKFTTFDKLIRVSTALIFYGFILIIILFGVSTNFLKNKALYLQDQNPVLNNRIANNIRNIDSINEKPLLLPNTGYSNHYNLIGFSPLQIKVDDGYHYWVKIIDSYTGSEVSSYFIRSGDTLNVDLPVGSYKIKYAYGQNWFGEDKLFGANTIYIQANTVFNFNFDGSTYNGYTIELIKKTDGNLTTSSIPKAQF